MATIDSLKQALRSKTEEKNLGFKRPLSDAHYKAGFDIFAQDPEQTTQLESIISELSQLLSPLFNCRDHVSVLEIGPGPKSVLGNLPRCQRRKIRKYVAFEPNGLYAAKVGEWLSSPSGIKDNEDQKKRENAPFPCLESLPNIQRSPFRLDKHKENGTFGTQEKFDIILFCHSMYGMKPKARYIERALEMLATHPKGGEMVVVVHRGKALYFDGLVCHRTASFPTGTIRVADTDDELDNFSSFLVGYILEGMGTTERAVRAEWRKVCRALAHREEASPHLLVFSSPAFMATFNHHAASLAELAAQVPLFNGEKIVKNREARLHNPAAVVRPTEIRHVQQCIQWALKHGIGLAVIGGGHSGHCIQSNVVSVDMEAFSQVHIVTAGDDCGVEPDSTSSSPLVIAQAGSKTGDIVRKAMEAGITVTLGSRPSVGAGLWLQGGMGHLSRKYGLACDAIIGAVVVSANSGQVLCIGCVPSQHQPVGTARPKNEKDMLWALKGAGTNFGIVLSVTFKAHKASNYLTRNWVVPISNSLRMQNKLGDFDKLVASKMPRDCSADVYLYWDIDQLHLGVTTIEASMPSSTPTAPFLSTPADTILGPVKSSKIVDSIGMFETDMYMSGMHGGHGGGKTSSFKRCLFLKHIGAPHVAKYLVAAIENRPSPLSYLHLLHCGGAVSDVPADATAFGCRDWSFACVVTGIWPREQDGSETTKATVQWVYNVCNDLLPMSSGVYGADLGPDPRDAVFADKAFGPNLPRLARLKHSSDPCNVLAYTCPLPKTPMEPKLIILVTGKSGVGKDFCADIWASTFIACTHKSLKARAVSISETTKKEYARNTGADFNRLLCDHAYKEQHRIALTKFFQDQVLHRPQLPEEHFLDAVYDSADVNVLLITGMREEAPVATLSHLVPYSRLLEVRVTTNEETRRVRRGFDSAEDNNGSIDGTSKYYPNLMFNNTMNGDEVVRMFAEKHLIPFLHEDLQRLANLVHRIPDFPRPGIDFRHVLNISQQPGGLTLCTSLLQSHFTGDWTKVNFVVCCEAGGFIYASALASRTNVPLALVREAGKLPQPTASVLKSASHISYSTNHDSQEKRIEVDRDLIPRGASVVVVDDVLATGNTLCAVLHLLNKVGVDVENISVMVVAEFPAHRGRELLRQHGFGRVTVQSLLIIGGA